VADAAFAGEALAGLALIDTLALAARSESMLP
jgi:hypothetical protein